MSALGTTETDCCEDVNVNDYDPRKERYSNSSTSNLKFENVSSPIPAQIADREDAKLFFETYRNVFVPYAGTSQSTSHALLSLLYALRENSPTKGSVLERIKSYSLGGDVEIINKTDSVFNLSEEEIVDVSLESKKAFREALKNIKWYGQDERETDVRTFSCYNYDDYDVCGDVYLEIVLSDTLGVKSSKVYSHSPLNIASIY